MFKLRYSIFLMLPIILRCNDVTVSPSDIEMDAERFIGTYPSSDREHSWGLLGKVKTMDQTSITRWSTGDSLITGVVVEFDVQGNLTSLQQSSYQILCNNSYDDKDRLVQVVKYTGYPIDTTTYRYDSLGNLSEMIVGSKKITYLSTEKGLFGFRVGKKSDGIRSDSVIFDSNCRAVEVYLFGNDNRITGKRVLSGDTIKCYSIDKSTAMSLIMVVCGGVSLYLNSTTQHTEGSIISSDNHGNSLLYRSTSTIKSSGDQTTQKISTNYTYHE